MTLQEITAHALALGITPEAFPEFFTLEHISCEAAFCHCKGAGQTFYTCTLPSPDSDDPRACLWDGFYMRALTDGNKDVRVERNRFTPSWPWSVSDDRDMPWDGSFRAMTPTAALRAAWLAKGGEGMRQPIMVWVTPPINEHFHAPRLWWFRFYAAWLVLLGRADVVGRTQEGVKA